MNRKLNGHRLLTALAAPLLVSSVALAPAFAAPGNSAAVAPTGPSCELVPNGAGDPGGDRGYDLRLSGFPANQSVRVEGPRSSFRATVDGQGSLDRQDVRYGKYSVNYRDGGENQRKRVGCATTGQKPGSGKQDVKVTGVAVKTLTKPGTVVDCTKTNKAEFDGSITATGQGKVDYYWTYASSADPHSSGSVDFTSGTTGHSLLKVVDVSGMANVASVSVFVTLHVPDHNMSARSEQVVLTCAKP
ncbi:hypothetical protein KPP03845_100169 [Streptomyces xanthophaeus]|uniref:hypothetical protein n=1 Tax=Streptomyces xanthophaeus TaxID=67385 RepID=UPI00233EA81F|nr:hypothetical protein [Streptomyces xanthophaeus]WCD83850.1 hypothetical protein KPP03845_100169 [Streptomyces xanthophaeus]